jgi:hypothetical protein
MDYWDPAISGGCMPAAAATLTTPGWFRTLQIAVSARKIQLNTVFPQTALALIIAPP